jgi:hypothetical protein
VDYPEYLGGFVNLYAEYPLGSIFIRKHGSVYQGPYILVDWQENVENPGAGLRIGNEYTDLNSFTFRESPPILSSYYILVYRVNVFFRENFSFAESGNIKLRESPIQIEKIDPIENVRLHIRSRTDFNFLIWRSSNYRGIKEFFAHYGADTVLEKREARSPLEAIALAGAGEDSP